MSQKEVPDKILYSPKNSVHKYHTTRCRFVKSAGYIVEKTDPAVIEPLIEQRDLCYYCNTDE